MKRPVFLLALGAVAVGVIGYLLLQPRGPHRGALQGREIATRGLAVHLAQTFPGQRALVVSNPYMQQGGLPREIRQMEEAGLRGLKDGFGTKVTVKAVVFPELRPEVKENPRAVFIDPETTTPMSYLVAEDAIDNLVNRNPGAELVVSLIGLPANLRAVRCWQSREGPRFVLVLPDLRVIGNRVAVRQAMQSGKLVAFVMAKPGAPESPPGSDFAIEFEKRFVLVTPENVDQMMRAYPQIFPAG